MIVLDEQLLGRDLEDKIARWYQGAVVFITELRPNSIIKDDAIPHLLHQQSEPTFVTINERDFWRKIQAHADYCIVCFALPDPRAREIADRLRELFSLPLLNTKAQRMGKVIRVSDSGVSYYTASDATVRVVSP